ncbi:MAG: hypothetical protein WHS89_02920 [Acidimicrobiales bacterium]|jgi:hypothetical protein
MHHPRSRRRSLALAALAGLIAGLLVYRQRALDASERAFRMRYDSPS